MGAISYLPCKNPFDKKKKLLILTELALAVFLFLLPGGPGRPVTEDGPDPDDLANFHRNGWPVDISLPELFDYYAAEQVAGASDNDPGNGDGTDLTVVEEKEENDHSEESSQLDSTSDGAKEESANRPPHHDNQKDTNQDPEVETVSDEQAGSEEEQAYQQDPAPVINQIDVNVAPEAAENQTISTQENTSVLVQLLATDADGDSLSFDIIDGPSNGTLGLFNATTGSAIYTPNAGFVGSDWFDFMVTDEGGKSDGARVYIQVIGADSNAVTGGGGNYTAVEDEPVPIELGAGANGTDGTNEVMVPPQHGTVTVNSNDTIVYLPDPNYSGPDSFVVNTIDSTGSTVTQNVTVNVIPVNDPPVAPNLTVITAEDTPIILTLVNGTSDVDGDVTSLTITAQPSYGVISISSDNVTITYTPNQDFQGTDTFVYTIADSAHSSSGTVGITVTQVNDAPTLVGGSNLEISTSQGSPVQINILSYVFDADGDALTISNITQPTNGIVSANSDGTVTYAPAPGFVGQDSFTYAVTDPSGASVTVTLTITVSPPGDDLSTTDVPPTSGAPAAYDIGVVLDEDTSALVQLGGSVANQDSGTYSVVSGPLHGTITIVDSVAGTVQYTPFGDYFGSDSFTYMVSDGTTDSVIATVELVVNGIDDIPSANDIWAYGEEGSPTIIEVLPGLVDVDGDVISVDITDGPEHGVATINGDGTITYVPHPDFSGTDSFVYTLSDGNGGSSSATVGITLGPVNDVPLSASGSVIVDEDGSVEIQLSATDPDSIVLDFEITDLPQHGSLEVTPGSNIVIYTPEPNYHGTDSFSYRVTDGLAYSDTATVSIVINSVSDVPVADSHAFTILEDASLLGDVLLDDVDVDGDTLSASLVQGSTLHGTVVLETDGSFAFMPEQDFSGLASFQYQLSDGHGGIATATVTITISEVNDAPVAQNDLVHIGPDSEVLIDVLSNDVDSDSNAITIDLVGTPSHGTVEISSDGQGVIFKPSPGFTGEDTFSYTITDGEHSTSATVDVIVYENGEAVDEGSNSAGGSDHYCDDDEHDDCDEHEDDDCDDDDDGRDDEYGYNGNDEDEADHDNQVTGGGRILATEGHASFGFNAKNHASAVKGEIQFQDHSIGLKMHGHEITSLLVRGSEAEFIGTGKVKGAGPVEFHVIIQDNGEPGTSDAFSITITGLVEYAASGTLTGGNIQIHG